MLVVIETIAFVATAILAVLWARNPSGNYEPFTVICGLVGTGTEIMRRFAKPKGFLNLKPKPDANISEIHDWIYCNVNLLDLSETLPYALDLANKIKNDDFENWVKMELYGYN